MKEKSKRPEASSPIVAAALTMEQAIQRYDGLVTEAARAAPPKRYRRESCDRKSPVNYG